MKSFSKLSLNETIDLANSNIDKFIIYGSDRVHDLMESGALNNYASELFRGKTNVSINTILEQFYQTNYDGNYDTLIESFNLLTESTNEQEIRLNNIISNYVNFVNENVNFPSSQIVLKEAININADSVLKYLLNEGYYVLSKIDVKSTLDSMIFENCDDKYKLELKDDPNYILGLTESIARAIKYTLASNKCSAENTVIGKSFLESLNNIYSIYKEGIDLVKTNDNQASDLFKLFLNDKAISYNFAIQNIDAALKDPATFVQYAIEYYSQWLTSTRGRLSYKFSGEIFTRLDDMSTMYNSQHPMTQVTYPYPEYYFTERKMLELLDILLNMSQLLRMDLRNLVCKYITTIRPLIESYHRDYSRSSVRTGF